MGIEDDVIPMHAVLETLSETCDVIIGSHAHVTQPHFFYRNTLVVPQMGNLLFPMHLSPFHVSVQKTFIRQCYS